MEYPVFKFTDSGIINNMSEGEQIKQLKKYPLELYYIKKPTILTCRAACKSDGRALHFVPEELKTPEVCLIACTQNGIAISFVPDHLRTTRLCQIACAQNGLAVHFLPKNKQTQELLHLVKSNGYELTEEQEAKIMQSELEWVI